MIRSAHGYRISDYGANYVYYVISLSIYSHENTYNQKKGSILQD